MVVVKNRPLALGRILFNEGKRRKKLLFFSGKLDLVLAVARGVATRHHRRQVADGAPELCRRPRQALSRPTEDDELPAQVGRLRSQPRGHPKRRRPSGCFKVLLGKGERGSRVVEGTA